LTQPPPRRPLFPYTTLFRSRVAARRKVWSMFPLRRVLCGSLVAAVVATAGAARGQNVTAAPPQAPPPTVMENVAFDQRLDAALPDRKSTRLNSSHVKISYAV